MQEGFREALIEPPWFREVPVSQATPHSNKISAQKDSIKLFINCYPRNFYCFKSYFDKDGSLYFTMYLQKGVNLDDVYD